jgi:asparagine synthetase B (glutamine-hydrolysing)
LLEALMRLRDFVWDGTAFVDAGGAAASLDRDLEGQFALAAGDGESVVLARDRYGVNKLFYAISAAGAVVAANYVVDLVRRGIPFAAIHSVPPGCRTRIAAARGEISTTRRNSLPEPSPARLAQAAPRIRSALESWFARLASRHAESEVCVMLSGGLDSSLIAALARRHFARVTAFTYSFVEPDGALSEDARYAERVAEHLRLPFRLVRASPDDLRLALDDALVYGQDWRDFNVHCAVVNELLARAVAAWTREASDGRPRLVLTGDMMNEILADYSPVRLGGVEYYTLPELEPERLRRILIRGLDAGDREVGVFGHHGLALVQPYGLVLEEYLRVPLASLGTEGKRGLVMQVAQDLLPGFVGERTKVRAQVGSSERPVGILPLFAEAGWDAQWLRRAWCRLLAVDDEAELLRFVRAGGYRVRTRFPERVEHGYYTE